MASWVLVSSVQAGSAACSSPCMSLLAAPHVPLPPLPAAGSGRLRRVCCAAQQPAAAGDATGSMPAVSSSPPNNDDSCGQTDGPIDWFELELRFYQAAGCVAAVVILSLLYKPFFIIPYVGPVLWFGYAAFLFGHIFWGGSAASRWHCRLADPSLLGPSRPGHTRSLENRSALPQTHPPLYHITHHSPRCPRSLPLLRSFQRLCSCLLATHTCPACLFAANLACLVKMNDRSKMRPGD